MFIRYMAAAVAAAAVSAASVTVSAAMYPDVPEGHWAEEVIEEVSEAGIMHGRTNGDFGLGDTVTRAEFAAMLTRLMGWESSGGEPGFADVTDGSWYSGNVAALYSRGVVSGDMFRPDDDITRREMAVMLIKALGYDSLAEGIGSSSFSDVTADIGYIEIARDFGIINGRSETEFDPDGCALREESAAMMMRLRDRYYADIDELHGFYAISSWAQREYAAEMDSASFGWSRLEYTDDGAVFLNTTSEGGNVWCIPDGYADAVTYLAENGVSENFAVTMTDPDDASAILTNAGNRNAAVSAVAAAAEGYDGVTIDFEGLSGAELREGLNVFMRELREAVGSKPLYIAVHPVLEEGEYYDAYDYRTLGDLADRVILMAHDYAPVSMPESLLGSDYIYTPVTPFDEVYNALKCITDPEIGVGDRSKIMLALSLSSTAAWETENGGIVKTEPVHPAMDTLAARLAQPGTVINYSDAYRNPYARYMTEDGSEILIWYEDSRSVRDKAELAKMFGVNALSVWRIGEIRNDSADTYMDVWDELMRLRGGDKQ